MQKLLRIYLNFGAVYLIFDGLIYLFNIRLASVVNVWPTSALSYARLLDTVYASFVFLAAILIFIAQRDLEKYKNLIFCSAIWAFFHGFLLVSFSLTKTFNNDLSLLPSLHIWIPFYSQFLLFEAALLFVYIVLVILWFKGGKNG